MKSKSIFIIISAIVYGVLYYQQEIGINVLIFSLIQLIGFFSLSDEKLTLGWNKLTLAGLGVLISGMAAFVFASYLALFMNVISLLILGGLAEKNTLSIFSSVVQSGYSILTGIGYAANRAAALEQKEGEGWTKTSKNFKKVVIFAASLVIVLVFFGLYRNSSTAFKQLTDEIDWSFISVGWIAFTLVGAYLIYNLHTQNIFGSMVSYEESTPDRIQDKQDFSKLDELMSLESELTWVKTLMYMLNSLLAIVVIVDLLCICNIYQPIEEPNLSANVHQGIGAIIGSIILAISIILYFFRGRLNFINQSKHIQNLASIWALLNLTLVIITGVKNQLYINEFFLTYKRIGVYAYLVACIIGLIFTILKINQVKSNWYLVKRVSLVIYSIAIFSPLCNWDKIIIEYNFKHANEDATNFDIAYLLSLHPINIPYIEQKISEYPKFSGAMKVYRTERMEDYQFYIYNTDDWRSFSLRKYNIKY